MTPIRGTPMTDKHAAPSGCDLDPGRFDPENAEHSWTLPSHWYTDASVYRREHEAIFYRSWIYQGHVSQVPEPGDFICGSVADQSIVVLRGDDGELRAFYNVCSHRAHPLLEGTGNTRLIVCPYHQWCYRTDGSFHGARGRDKLKDWIPDNADLKRVRLEIYAGLIFANLDENTDPLADQAAKLLADMHEICPQLSELRHVRRTERSIAANWKTVVDNNHECYHCAVNHKSLMDLVDYRDKAVWSDDGITFSHAVERNANDNSAYRISADDAAQDSLFSYIWPTTIPLFFPGTPSLVVFQILPTGPETCTVRHDFLFTSQTPSEREAAFMDWITGTLIVEDMRLCEAVQTGLRSRGYHQGRFVVDRNHPDFSEHHVHFFQRFVHDALMGAD